MKISNAEETILSLTEQVYTLNKRLECAHEAQHMLTAELDSQIPNINYTNQLNVKLFYELENLKKNSQQRENELLKKLISAQNETRNANLNVERNDKRISILSAKLVHIQEMGIYSETQGDDVQEEIIGICL